MHTHSALHCGTGQSAGIVDLPIARDRATNLPLVPGSSLRGVLRDELTNTEAEIAEHLFGPRKIERNDQSFAGAFSVGDANLLILPVRSLAGIVAYATCPFILKQYSRDLRRDSSNTALAIPVPEENKALCGENNQNKMDDNLLVLEDLDVSVTENESVQKWAETIADQIYTESDDKTDFTQRFIVLPDNLFSYLSETATEIRTRIRINEATGVVKDGALWTEENLPAHAVLWGVFSIGDSRRPSDKKTTSAQELKEKLAPGYLLQLGGNSGIGRGLASVFFSKNDGVA